MKTIYYPGWGVVWKIYSRENLKKSIWLPLVLTVVSFAICFFSGKASLDLIEYVACLLYTSQKKRQNHICPLQLDIVERLIERYSNKGELVFDPFGGIGTVPYCAVKLGRRGLSTELNYDYWKDSLTYLREIEMEVEAPTLFDLMGIPERMTAVSYTHLMMKGAVGSCSVLRTSVRRISLAGSTCPYLIARR